MPRLFRREKPRALSPAVVTRTIALAITTIWNFYLYKTRIFKNSDEELLG